MTETAVVEEAAKIAALQQEENLSPEAELKMLLEVEATKVHDNQQLNLSRETVLRILELFSQRECLTDEERQLINQMVVDLSNELKDSKYSQASIHLAFSLVGGGVGAIGSAYYPGASVLGDTINRFGTVSDSIHGANQVWMEVGKQLRTGDLSHDETLSEKIHRAMDSIAKAVGEVENAWHGARRTR